MFVIVDLEAVRLCLIEVHRHEIEAAGVHFLDNLHILDGCLLLLSQRVFPFFVIFHIIFQPVASHAHELVGKCGRTNGEVRRIVRQRIENFIVSDAVRHHDVRRRVGFREHVLDLFT